MREWTLSSKTVHSKKIVCIYEKYQIVNVNIKMYKSDKIKMYNYSKLT